jgi:tetratricopeptide (TPR) repeat protein
MKVFACALVLIGFPAQGQYIGSKSCAQCHAAQYQAFTRTPMGRSLAAVSVTVAPEFTKPAQFVHQKTGRHYRIFQKQSRLLIEEFFLDKNQSVVYSDPRNIRYAIGSGNHARSFLIERAGRIYQAPITFFKNAGRWDMSPGYNTADYVGFTRRVTVNCLYCHSGRANALNQAGDVFQASQAFAETAIGCERCHSPGQAHLAQPGKAIVNPAKLPAELRDQVCEQCHLFGAARVAQPGKSPTDYRPGERLDTVLAVYDWNTTATIAPTVTGHPQEMKQSACWQKSQNRLWCGSCHEVHQKNLRAPTAAFYRAKCLGCHTRDKCSRAADASSAAHRQNDCIACHMPKRPVIESAHVAFTDHRILRTPKPDIKPRLEGAKLRPILPAELDDPVIASRNLGFAYAELASSTGRQEFHQRVVEILRPLAGTNISDASFWLTLGEAHLASGQVADAEEAFRKAVTLNAGLASAHYALGYLLQLRNQLPDAIQAYRRAVAIDPYKAEAFGNLAAAYFKTGERDKALAALKTALALEPGNLKWLESERHFH